MDRLCTKNAAKNMYLIHLVRAGKVDSGRETY